MAKAMQQPEERHREVLSPEAQAFLRNRGFSGSFIAGLQMMLQEAGPVYARTEYEGPGRQARSSCGPLQSPLSR
ncbi:hypothetical protein GF318_00205 [Candidatus Micrarchaeota archaeon]|nr:hypothetical protein [Candidatus Micrarchaeota archaeon]